MLRTSFSEMSLILGLDISVILSDNRKTSIKIPNMKEMYENVKLDYFFKILSIDLEKVFEEMSNISFEATTLQGVFIGMKLQEIDIDVVEEGLSIISDDLKLTKKGIALNDIPLEEKDLQYIKNIVLVGVGMMTMEDFRKAEIFLSESDIDKELREKQEKIDKIKKKKQKVLPKIDTQSVTMPEVIITILSLIPGTTIESLRELNQFSLQWLYKYAQKMVYDRIYVTAAGFGNLPKGDKYKFITEK